MNPLPNAVCLPVDVDRALLVGRVWRAGPYAGPSVVVLRDGQLVDISAHAPTMADLLEHPDLHDIARHAPGEVLDSVENVVLRSQTPAVVPAAEPQDNSLLAPCDLQAIKACGVTFAVSLLERLIEEESRGNAASAESTRLRLRALIGDDLSCIRPGSVEAGRLKEELLARGAWSQYLEVGLGPDAEVFTKSQPLSAVGFGASVGLLQASNWNNPEPEIVLAVNSQGLAVGATLGNDVNLRDIEGRSALLLGKAKDNNGSCAIGPFIRLFDAHFTMDTLRSANVSLCIEGADDGFLLNGVSHMEQISRDPLALIAQVCGDHHQYPDGFMLFLGTMFSPTQDRHGPGQGFTHVRGDRVTIASPSLGSLVNTVQLCDEIPPWTFGFRALMSNLSARKLVTALV